VQASIAPRWNLSQKEGSIQNVPVKSSPLPVIKRSRMFGLPEDTMIEDLHQSMKNKKFPSGILTGTEKISKCSSGESNRYLKGNSTRRDFVIWNEYACDNFNGTLLKLTTSSSSNSTFPVPRGTQSDLAPLSTDSLSPFESLLPIFPKGTESEMEFRSFELCSQYHHFTWAETYESSWYEEKPVSGQRITAKRQRNPQAGILGASNKNKLSLSRRTAKQHDGNGAVNNQAELLKKTRCLL
ncbi:hypothetical protein CU098_013073, partial [Rhizopus stolonifer]